MLVVSSAAALAFEEFLNLNLNLSWNYSVRYGLQQWIFLWTLSFFLMNMQSNNPDKECKSKTWFSFLLLWKKMAILIFRKPLFGVLNQRIPFFEMQSSVSFKRTSKMTPFDVDKVNGYGKTMAEYFWCLKNFFQKLSSRYCDIHIISR